MNIYSYIHTSNLSDQKKYKSLKKSIDRDRSKAINKRLKEKAYMTDMEYISGAFLEMYEPYLKDIVCRLFEKGYSIDISSGFCSNKFQYQSLNGHFSLDYLTKNKLEKEGVKIRDINGFRSLFFFAENLDLDDIKQKWLQIIEILPDKGKLINPSQNPKAVLFRRKYISRDPQLQRQRLFEKMEYKIRISLEKEVKKRKKTNPHPNIVESRLGVFIEELEPQVRQAVLKMNRKGYSTDLSGFVNNSRDQMIEGDFRLEEKIINKLSLSGIKVESNPSGYTRLLFTPKEANLGKIEKKWNEIVSLLPSRNKTAEFSMTRRARDFRLKYI
ncbi:hypothetical protein A2153_06035 [Candidatus Gottesmanbacteria bacterium RBG_16_38_7b]|uniref:Uncharacterized protein n=1 Tax=Candidatus Gottesmanbacteria bacterium RBG_16_38_7b TaxID=1798372 RepID=A0A1F5YJG8_9BACT|nr:MAG: hypothetical protein A2153_06035 [Candidatus Gottesmanbacteria bacterium RBG_16_38_7b]